MYVLNIIWTHLTEEIKYNLKKFFFKTYFFFFCEDKNIKSAWMCKREDSILSLTNYGELFMNVQILKCTGGKEGKKERKK